MATTKAFDFKVEALAPNKPEAITAQIRSAALELLQNEIVDLVLGYSRGWREDVITPCFVTTSAEVNRLVFDERCSHNLARYLVGCDGYLTAPHKTAGGKPRVAVVARPSTLRAIAGLIQEHQIEREDLVILGITDGTPVGVEPDLQVGEIQVDAEGEQRIKTQIEQLEKMTASERWAWWEEQFTRCIRCYACRQVCPFCYCEQCIADENQPQWIERSCSATNNRAWNTIRAFHLVGRCVGCGECDRVCPVDIPLTVLNTKMRAEVEEAFGYVAGMSVDAPPALFDFRTGDPNNFVR
jgi:formate dehydrogenase (coenzyme F420) beta subunit